MRWNEIKYACEYEKEGIDINVHIHIQAAQTITTSKITLTHVGEAGSEGVRLGLSQRRHALRALEVRLRELSVAADERLAVLRGVRDVFLEEREVERDLLHLHVRR